MENPYVTQEANDLVRDTLTPTSRCKTKEFIPFNEGDLIVCFDHEEIYYYSESRDWYVVFHQPNWFKQADECLDQTILDKANALLVVYSKMGKADSINFNELGITNGYFRKNKIKKVLER